MCPPNVSHSSDAWTQHSIFFRSRDTKFIRGDGDCWEVIERGHSRGEACEDLGADKKGGI